MTKMILIDKNTIPENTVYYNAGIIYELLLNNGPQNFDSLYRSVRNNTGINNIRIYNLALDFLFLVSKINVDHMGLLYVFKKN